MANTYYSGQGRFYTAERDALGQPKGFDLVGNVPALEISVEITKFEHKESETGNRAIDLTIVQEKKGTFTMTLENLSLANLALAFWGASKDVSGAAVAAEGHALYAGKRVAADFPNWDTAPTPTVIHAAGEAASAWQATTAYVVGDYVTDVADSGQFWKCTIAGTSDSGEPSWPTTPGATVVDATVTWTCMGSSTLVVDTDYTIDSTHGVVIVDAAADIYDGETWDFAYTHKGGQQMDAFLVTSQTRWIRFEGLNTVDNSPVVIDMFKAELDPLTGYGLINEEIGSLEISGNLLLDDLRTDDGINSQLFRQVNVVDTP